jgi:hypothetical protein
MACRIPRTRTCLHLGCRRYAVKDNHSLDIVRFSKKITLFTDSRGGIALLLTAALESCQNYRK